MPPRNQKKNMKKKRNYKNSKVSRNLSITPTKTYGFSRTRQHLLALESPDDGWITTIDGACVKTFSHSLSELADYGDFTNLYKQYKLNMCILKIFPSYSQVVSSTAPVASTNIIITIWKNTHGELLDATFDDNKLLQIQRKRQFMFPMNRPTTIKMYLRQLSEIYAPTTITPPTIAPAYGTIRPKYISTAEPTTPHYSYNIHIKKVDGAAFGSNSPRLLMKEQVYLTTKQVH